jgi:acrylyl-CoA reductase (NADPH)
MTVLTFEALRVHKGESVGTPRLESLTLDDLTAGDVVIRVVYSSINYKDALAVTGKGAILRGLPKIPGIDLAGVVHASVVPEYRRGDRVLVTGCNVGEQLDGGFAEYARVPAAAVVPLPAGLSLREAMVLGTAGFTAALALRRMLENHQRPELGPVAVTGATGGVGAIALMLFKRAGFQLSAITGKPSEHAYLQELGADEVVERTTLEMGRKPLEKARWGGAVDSLGGDMLAYLTRTVVPWGNIASIGLAQSPALATTVMPFILRGVSVLGIHSVEMPRAWRTALWTQLAGEWKPFDLERRIVRSVVSLEQVSAACEELIAGRARGRYVVQIAEDPA